MRGRIVIAGIGHTAYGKQPGRSTVSLNLEACRKAIEDAGVEPGEVDSLLVKVPTSAGSTPASSMALRQASRLRETVERPGCLP